MEKSFEYTPVYDKKEDKFSPEFLDSEKLLFLANYLKDRFAELKSTKDEEKELLIETKLSVERIIKKEDFGLKQLESVYNVYEDLLEYLEEKSLPAFTEFIKEGFELEESVVLDPSLEEGLLVEESNDDHLLTMEDLIEAQAIGNLTKKKIVNKSIKVDLTAEPVDTELDFEAREALGKIFNDKDFGKGVVSAKETWLDSEDAEEIVDNIVDNQLDSIEEEIVSIENIAENPEAALVETQKRLVIEAELSEETSVLGQNKRSEITSFKFSTERTRDSLANLSRKDFKNSEDFEKDKKRLKSKLNNRENKLIRLEKESLEINLKDFFESREKSIDAYLENLAERRDKMAIVALYNIYEKYGKRRLLPGAWNEKLKRHGFLGKLVADGMAVNTAIEFSLLGGGFAVGSSSIIAADILTGLHIPAEIRSDALLTLASEGFAKSHDWENALSENDLNAFTYKELLKYINHYEARTLLEGEGVDNDDYYQNVIKVFHKKIEIEKEKGELTEEAIKEFLIEENAKINSELFDVFSKKDLSEEDQRLDAKKIVLFIKEGLFKKTLDNLYFSKNQTVELEKGNTITKQFTEYDINIAESVMGMESEDENLLEEKSIVENKLTEEMKNNLADKFLNSHHVLSGNNALVEIVNEKIQVAFDIGRGGHFELKQHALRRLIIDVFPMEELIDLDAFSALDAGRVERTVTIFNTLLENKSFYEFSPNFIDNLIELKDGQLIIHDYSEFAIVSRNILAEAKEWIVSTENKFVRIALAIPEEVWSKILDMKILDIKMKSVK